MPADAGFTVDVATTGVTAVWIPAAVSAVRFDGNAVRQVLVREQSATVAFQENGSRQLQLDDGSSITLLSRRLPLASGDRALVMPRNQLETALANGDLTGARWIGDLTPSQPSDFLGAVQGTFVWREADAATGTVGLRPPQVGAIHAVLAHWTTRSAEPVTVVMPTGTGKTETMLGLLCAARPQRLLVVVPSDALRSQISSKFETLGILPTTGIVPNGIPLPVVGQVGHRFSSVASAEQFADACNVIVATPAALYACAPDVRRALLERCSHLFVDEAHHVAARTWREIRDNFAPRPVVQFTATPFREDGRHLGGRLIYSYPLREAQRNGYFATVNFVSVLDLGAHDRAVAERAVERLRTDLDDGHDHLLMARVNTISRAPEVVGIYRAIAPELQPVILHSAHPAAERRASLAAIRDRRSRVIVCVNMLGEGFDLPALKVAAIHDAHKSLGVTLQFVGRFSRSVPALGEATVVVGRPGGDFDPNLRRLYSEDADWNAVIRDLSEGAVAQAADVSDFEAAFTSLPDDIAIQSLLPKMSTVVYRTQAEPWDVEGVLRSFAEDRLLTHPLPVNERDHVVWFVTEDRSPVRWGELATVEDVAHNLFLIYWDEAHGLLFINSSDNTSLHEALARAVGGETATRVTGETVYRVMANIARLVPTNVGVLDVRSYVRRFSMHVGADVTEGFPAAEAQTKSKTNIFAYGYEEGNRVSVGASLKGRIWSYQVASSIKQWMDWCDYVGRKLIDETLSVDAVMGSFIRPEVCEERPSLMPIAMEWPWELLGGPGETLRVAHEGSIWPLLEAELQITAQSTNGPIPFRIGTPGWQLDYELDIRDGAMHFRAVASDADVMAQERRTPLTRFLTDRPPSIIFESDAVVVPPAILLRPARDLPAFDPANLRVLDWTGVDLSVKSRGQTHRADSIQARMLAHVDGLAAWDVLLDDDGPGEIADIVGMRMAGAALEILFVHCKYAGGGVPRAQVEDLYVVCGQAQKSARWRRNIDDLLRRLTSRERRRLQRGRVSGFVRGDEQSLYEITDKAHLLRPNLTVAIAQPGMSRSGVSVPMLELLASAEVYVHEIAASDFHVYCSA